jgi:hypothetical protein
MPLARRDVCLEERRDERSLRLARTPQNCSHTFCYFRYSVIKFTQLILSKFRSSVINLTYQMTSLLLFPYVYFSFDYCQRIGLARFCEQQLRV